MPAEIPPEMLDHMLASVLCDRLNAMLDDEHVQRALYDLSQARVQVHRELGPHPTIQVDAESGPYTVGFIGMLNGIVGALPDSHPDYPGWGLLTFHVDPKAKRVTHVCLTGDPQ